MNAPFSHPHLGPAALQFLGGKHQLFIGGRFVDAKAGRTFDTYDPSSGRVVAKVAAGEAADIDAAVTAARQAFESGPWSRMTGSERAKLMWKLAELIEAHRDELAELESLNNGKPIANIRNSDIPNSCEVLRYTAGWATKLTGETLSLAQPLATGCTVVLKPAEQTPLTALRLARLIQEAGIPDGVINIVTGFGETAGAALAAHPGVDKIAFTGSAEVGRLIVQAAAGNLKKVSLELGGKSPVIVFPDADLNIAVPGAARAIFNNSGQVCAAGSRLYAHASVFDRLIEGVAQEAGKLKIGPGLDPGTQMGPLVSQEQLDRVAGYLAQGRSDGAKVVTGGSRVGNEGYFIAPTVLTETKPEMSVVREEIFGPVLCAMSFDDNDLVRIAEEANRTTYGLAASVWTRNLGTAHKMARRLRAGSIGVNMHGTLDPAMPFGGYKQSGWGREKGKEVLDLYTEVKAVVMAL